MIQTNQPDTLCEQPSLYRIYKAEHKIAPFRSRMTFHQHTEHAFTNMRIEQAELLDKTCQSIFWHGMDGVLKTIIMLLVELDTGSDQIRKDIG